MYIFSLIAATSYSALEHQKMSSGSLTRREASDRYMDIPLKHNSDAFSVHSSSKHKRSLWGDDEETTTTTMSSYSTFNDMTRTMKSANTTLNEDSYCDNDVCKKAAAAAFFLGYPCFGLVLFCALTFLGFTMGFCMNSCNVRGGIAGVSNAASCQLACYKEVRYTFVQNAGPGGCKKMKIACILVALCFVNSFFTVATWRLCLFTCMPNERINLNATYD